ncbi:LPXTG cell wall anchor domain-containing protein [Streptomyces sp. NPDC050600]|uniref:LPXTG cell wall anchor domain-containing protein n=1 Tax=Streptomyces sp. NPDC050600 TaxID=3157213 RepID=UPI0034146CE2
MKFRRILAAAVAAAALTAPVAVLSAAPAFADARQAAKPTVEELRLALTKAQAVYDAAVRNDAEVQKKVLATLKSLTLGGDHPLAVVYTAAEKAAETAAAAKTEADAKLEKARADQDALPEGATPEQEDAAQKAVDDAQKAVDEAAAAKTEADAKARRASDDMVDAQAAAAREASVARSAKDDARKALDAARKALADAEKAAGGTGCLRGDALAASLTGPDTIAAGGSGDYVFRLTNTSERTLGGVSGISTAFGWERIEQDWRHVKVDWSSVNSPKWQPADKGFASGTALKPGESFDFKLKVSVGTATEADSGELEIGVIRFTEEDGTCGYSTVGGHQHFTITGKHGKPEQPGKPGKPEKPEQPGKPAPGEGTGGTGGSTGSATGGGLATTGSSDATMPLALAGGAAVVLGAGAMVLVRRRKAGADA